MNINIKKTDRAVPNFLGKSMLGLGLLLLLTSRSFGAEWFVDGSAKSSGKGTADAPFLTINEALKASKNSDIITIKAGTYRETFDIRNDGKDGISGTPDHPFTIRAAPGERVILSGFKPITGWKPFRGNIQVANIGTADELKALQYGSITGLNTVYVGYNRRLIAQSPKTDEPPRLWQSAVLSADKKTLVVTDPEHLKGLSDLAGAYVQSFCSNPYAIRGSKILSSDPVAGTFTAEWDELPNGTCYILENRLDFLTKPGEWVCETETDGSQKLYYWPVEPADLDHIQTQWTRYLIRIIGTHDILIQGLEITGASGAGIKIVGATAQSEGITIEWNTIHNNGNHYDGMGIDGSMNNSTIAHNLFTANGVAAIYLNHSNKVQITNNLISYNYNDGIELFTKDDEITIAGNCIDHIANLFIHPDCLQCAAGVQNTHVLDNLMIGNVSCIMNNDFNGGEIKGNVLFSDVNTINGLGSNGVIPINLESNTIIGNIAIHKPTAHLTYTGNVLPEMLIDPTQYTGDRNLTGELRTCNPWAGFKDMGSFSAKTGQDQHSLLVPVQMRNVPKFTRAIDDDVSKSTPTIIFLGKAGTKGFVVGDHIEVMMDGVVRTVTALDEQACTITLDKPIGWAHIPRRFDIENWGEKTNFLHDTRLVDGSPGSNLSGKGGPVGSSIDIQAYLAGKFNGDDKRQVPEWPVDVPRQLDFYSNTGWAFGPH